MKGELAEYAGRCRSPCQRHVEVTVAERGLCFGDADDRFAMTPSAATGSLEPTAWYGCTSGATHARSLAGIAYRSSVDLTAGTRRHVRRFLAGSTTIMTSHRVELFRTERLTVRALSEGDAEGLFRVYGDPKAMRFVDDGQPIAWGDCLAWVEVTRRNVRLRGYGMCALERIEDRALVGFCGLVHPHGQPEVEVKYALASEHWGRGFATEAVRGMLAWGGRQFGIERVIATIHPDNAASRRVLEKAGFEARELRHDEDGSAVEVMVSSPAPR
jgi:RimJ/RimL family protein N-acetyltransferase